MKSKTRQQMVDLFNGSAAAKCFLISVKAGGIGINLTAASRVVVFDAPWNPSHNEQAVARSYRLGQLREVHVYRLVIDKWFESQMNTRAVTKTQLAERVVEQKATKQTADLAALSGARRGMPEESEDPDAEAVAGYGAGPARVRPAWGAGVAAAPCEAHLWRHPCTNPGMLVLQGPRRAASCFRSRG